MSRQNYVRVYVSKTDTLRDAETYTHLYRTVSVQRREKIDRLHRMEDKMLSLAAGLLLERALEDLGIGTYTLGYGENGKPYLKNIAGVHFNLSHSHAAVMCAVSDREVGCDVERIATPRLHIAKRFFHEDEYAHLTAARSQEEQRALFYRFWTLKESFMKVTGRGMTLPMNAFCISLTEDGAHVRHSLGAQTYHFKEYQFGDGYQHAVCALSSEFDRVVTLSLA